ncbi:MAG: permease-like cell division protein FtsX [Bacteroidota bacterium]|nr:permease-like cell division protein FtsX [Bacteroidota bacterium]
MGRKENTRNSLRKLRSSYMTTVVSTALVLFLLGLLGLLILNAKSLGDYVKENLGFSVILADGTREADIIQIQRSFDAAGFVKETNYITPEQAARDLQEELGENFLDFLGFNPLKPSIDIKLVASYANPDSIAMIEQIFLEYPQVQEVFYQESLVNLVNENVRKISVIMLIFSGFLFFISIALFNNTIRLLVYSKRFIIKTMQLVGATRSYILRPFLIKGITNGLAGAFIASLMFLSVVYVAQKQAPDLIVFTSREIVGSMMLFIFLMGALMAWLSTWFAVSKYLRSDQDALYY